MGSKAISRKPAGYKVVDARCGEEEEGDQDLGEESKNQEELPNWIGLTMNQKDKKEDSITREQRVSQEELQPVMNLGLDKMNGPHSCKMRKIG